MGQKATKGRGGGVGESSSAGSSQASSTASSPFASPRKLAAISADALEGLWCQLCGDEVLWVPASRARFLLQEIAGMTGVNYTDDKANNVLSEMLGGRRVREDDQFAHADFFALFFTWKTWQRDEERKEKEEVPLSQSLNERFMDFKNSREGLRLSNLGVALDLSRSDVRPPTFPHLAFPVGDLRIGDNIDAADYRDGVATSKAVWHIVGGGFLNCIVRAHSLSYVRSEGKETLVELVEAMRLLKCPQILQYLGSAKTPTELLFIYQEPSPDCVTLAHFLEKKEGEEAGTFHGLSSDDVKLITRRVCLGLGWLHSRKGYLHMQIRHDTIIVCPRSLRSWLMGVGETFLLKRMDMVDVQFLQRSVAYSAPELISALPCTAMTDVWSIGSLMYRMLAGADPLAHLQGSELLEAILKGKRQSLDQLEDRDPYLAGLIRRCWREMPSERPSISDIVSICTSLGGEMTEDDLSESMATGASASPGRHGTAIGTTAPASPFAGRTALFYSLQNTHPSRRSLDFSPAAPIPRTKRGPGLPQTTRSPSTAIWRSVSTNFEMSASSSFAEEEDGSLRSDAVRGSDSRSPRTSSATVSPSRSPSASNLILAVPEPISPSKPRPSWSCDGHLVAQTLMFEDDASQCLFYHGKWTLPNMAPRSVLVRLHKASESSTTAATTFLSRALQSSWDIVFKLTSAAVCNPELAKFVLTFHGAQVQPLLAECFEPVERVLSIEYFQGLDRSRKLAAVLNIATCVRVLHEDLKFVHRALTLQSFFLTADGCIKVLCCSTSSTKRTLQSLDLLPPEVVAGEAWLEPADVFALGFVLVDTLGSDLSQLQPIIVRMCAADPLARPSMVEVVQTIKTLLLE